MREIYSVDVAENITGEGALSSVKTLKVSSVYNSTPYQVETPNHIYVPGANL